MSKVLVLPSIHKHTSGPLCVYLFCLHLQHLTAAAAASATVDVAYCCMLMFVIVVLLLPFIVAILICMKRRQCRQACPPKGGRCKQLGINGRGNAKATLLAVGLFVFGVFSVFLCVFCFVLIILLSGHIRITRKLHKIVVSFQAKKKEIQLKLKMEISDIFH